MADSALTLARLRRTLDRLEPRARGAAGRFGCGHEGVDAGCGGGLARGRLHELFAAEEDASSGAGLALLLASRAGPGALLWLRTEGIGKRSGWLHAAGLRELGLDPAVLLLALAPDEPALLHSAAEAARCAGLAAVLVEGWGPMRGLDLTASRRLMLAAEASGVTLFLLRVAAEPAPSAAETRWRVAAAPSVALEAGAPGPATFEMELLRRRGGPPAGPWRVEWDRDRLCFRRPGDRDDDAGRGGRGADASRPAAPPAHAPLPRPRLPLVAGGAAAADPAASVRHRG